MKKGLRVSCNGDEYVVSGKIGEGAFGEVWRASPSYGKDVAVKFFKEDRDSIDSAVARFEAEARKMSGFSHRNVVTVYGKGKATYNGSDIPCYVMELLESSLMKKFSGNCTFSLEQIVSIVSGVGEGLQHAYSHGVKAHADIRPENILLDRDGCAKIADFGMMRLEQGYAQRIAMSMPTLGPSFSRTTAVKNKYAAPEVLEYGSAAATHLSDMYSLGRIGTKMLRKANKREDVALYERLQSVLAKAIAPTAAERFSSMAEFVSRLKGRDDAPVKGNEESHDIESVAGPYQSKQLASSIGKWASRGKLAVAATALLALCAWLSFRGCGDGKPGKPTPPGVDIRMSSVTNEYTATCDGAQLQVAPPALEQEKVVVPPPQEYAAPQECIPPQPVQQPPAPVQVAENPRSAGAERQSQTRTDRPASQQRRRSRSDNDTTPSTRRRRAHDEQQPPASQPVMVYLPSSPNGSDRVGIPCYNHDWPAEGVLFEDAQNILLIRRNCELTVLAIKQPQQERPETGAAMQGEPHSSDAGNQDAAQETETHPTESDAGSQAAAQRTEATPNPGCSDTH